MSTKVKGDGFMANLQEIITERAAEEATYRDQIVRVNKENARDYGITNIGVFNEESEKHFLQDYLEIPVNFYNKLSRDTQVAVFNERIAKFDRDLLIRGNTEHDIRAVLSPSYTIINHSEVLTGVQKAASQLHYDNIAVTQTHVKHGTMYTKLTIGDGDETTVGIVLANNETGGSSVAVDPLIYRKVCTNGLIVSTQERFYRKVHSGNHALSIEELIKAIQEAIAYARTSEELFKRSKYKNIIDVEAEIIQTVDNLELPKKITPLILEAYNSEPMATGFGIINAFTRAAQKFDDANVRVNIERTASRLLEVYK